MCHSWSDEASCDQVIDQKVDKDNIWTTMPVRCGHNGIRMLFRWGASLL